MNSAFLEAIKGLSREEKKSYFESHKGERFDQTLKAVNGGTGANVENPTSEVPYAGNWISSPGYVCEGKEIC